MQAAKGRGPSTNPAEMADVVTMQEHIAILLIEAVTCTAPKRVADTAQDWVSRVDLSSASPAREAAVMAEAFALAAALALFTPSAGGTVAIDRLAKRRGFTDPAEIAALAALRRAQFRVVHVERVESDGLAQVRDLPSDEILRVADGAMRGETAGLHLAGWLAPLPDGRQVFASGVTPLDEAGLAVAMGFVRPGKPGLVNALRCAEAVYRHVVLHGAPRVPGLNDPVPGEDDGLADEADRLDALALQWAEPGARRDPEDVQFVRAETDLGAILAMLASAADTRDHGLAALSGAYAAIAQIQIETVQRRASVGSGSLRLPMVEAALEYGIAAGELPPASRDIFAAVRRRLGATPGAGPVRSGADAELDKLIVRIQALRAKTVEQGCTEQEALSAAEKVAELLDRYGLSLSELDLRKQACEGVAVETERKRAGPIDDCVPVVAAFFDCRVWGEKDAAGMLRYVFFGLPADVAAARYLYDLVDQAFARETALFRASDAFAVMPSRLRRTATNSFQSGLGHGITAKLHALRTEREAALRRSSGRDLMVVKADIVETEMSALGLSLRTRSRSGGRRILKGAFEQGRITGLGFEHTPGIGDEG